MNNDWMLPRNTICIDERWRPSDLVADDAEHATVIVSRNPLADEIGPLVRFLSNYPHVSVCIPYHLKEPPDLSYVPHLPNLRRFRILAFDFDAFDQLALLPDTLESLELRATRSSTLSLAFLSRLATLRSLTLEGHKRDIAVISSLQTLEELTLRSITVPNFGFLEPLGALMRLELLLGSSTNLAALGKLKHVRQLALWKIRGLSSLAFVSNMTGLEKMELQELSLIKSLPDLSRNTKLKHISIQNMKRLEDLSSIAKAPSLKEFNLSYATAQDPEHIKSCLRESSVQRIHVAFGRAKANKEFDAWASREGYGQIGSAFDADNC